MAGICWALPMPHASLSLAIWSWSNPFPVARAVSPPVAPAPSPCRSDGLTKLHHVGPNGSCKHLGQGKIVHCLLVASDPSRWTCRRRGVGSEGYVKTVSDPSVKIPIINGNRGGVKKHLAFSVGIRLACHQAPFPDVIPVMTRLSTFLDKVVDRSNTLYGVTAEP